MPVPGTLPVRRIARENEADLSSPACLNMGTAKTKAFLFLTCHVSPHCSEAFKCSVQESARFFLKEVLLVQFCVDVLLRCSAWLFLCVLVVTRFYA